MVTAAVGVVALIISGIVIANAIVGDSPKETTAAASDQRLALKDGEASIPWSFKSLKDRILEVEVSFGGCYLRPRIVVDESRRGEVFVAAVAAIQPGQECYALGYVERFSVRLSESLAKRRLVHAPLFAISAAVVEVFFGSRRNLSAHEAIGGVQDYAEREPRAAGSFCDCRSRRKRRGGVPASAARKSRSTLRSILPPVRFVTQNVSTAT